MNEPKYITPKEVKDKYEVSYTTLRRWEAEGKLGTRKTPGGNRRYNSKDVGRIFGEPEGETGPTKSHYCYARVSSDHQRADLDRQIEYLQSKAKPGAIIIKDVGSGINWNRPGFKRLLGLAHDGKVASVAIAHRDRLCRFAYELVEWIFEKAGVKILVLSQG